MQIINEDRIKEITPEIIAELFAGLRSDEQARFFNHIDKVASTWPGPFCFQLQAITDEMDLTLAGRRVMHAIGDYSHWGLVQKCIDAAEDKTEIYDDDQH